MTNMLVLKVDRTLALKCRDIDDGVYNEVYNEIGSVNKVNS